MLSADYSCVKELCPLFFIPLLYCHNNSPCDNLPVWLPPTPYTPSPPFSSRQFKALSYVEEKFLIAKHNLFYEGDSPLKINKLTSEAAAPMTL